MELSTLIFLRPWWLLGLPLLALLAILISRRGADAGGWERVMPPAMLSAMRALGHLRGGDGYERLMPLLAAGLICLGLSGPGLPRADAPTLAGRGAVLIAVDMSPSVTEGPAMADARAAAAAVLTAAPGRPVGLLVYSDEAYLVAAPTADPATLESQIAVLGPDTMPSAGSRPAAALALARQMLRAGGDADLVLISDGGGMDEAARVEAQRLGGDDVRLSVLTLAGGLGGAADAAALEGLAAASAPARAPAPVLAGLSRRAGFELNPALSALQFRDFGPLIAALAVFPLLLLFRRTS